MRVTITKAGGVRAADRLRWKPIGVAVSLILGLALAASPVDIAQARQVPGASEQPLRRIVTEHTGHFAGQTIAYAVVAGDTLLRNRDGAVTGSLFSFSYLKKDTGPASDRPVMFIFNGGPGSSSLWLHMGVIGPRQVVFADDVNPPQVAPFPLVDNPDSVLAVADLVMIDPVGTGFSRYHTAGGPADFYGNEEDAASIVQFIEAWLTANNRWNSPKFILGESYGTTRAALLSTRLFGGVFQGALRGVSLNGVILVSGAGGLGRRGDPDPDSRFLTSFSNFAASAWYHNRIDRRGRTFEAFIAEAEAFAAGDLKAALGAGEALSADTRQAVATRMAGFVGLPATLLVEKNLRVLSGEFRNLLLADQGLQLGSYDSRYTLPLAGSGDDPVGDDPAMGRYSSAFVGAFHTYLHDELGVRLDEPYRVISFGEVNLAWTRPDNLRPHPAFNPQGNSDLVIAMRRNPQLRLMTVHGYFDMGATVGEAARAIDISGVPRDRVDERRYQSGHMTYVGPSATLMSNDIKTFVLRAAPGPTSRR
jgi:carboxypeptidase C (cathepsin A)